MLFTRIQSGLLPFEGQVLHLWHRSKCGHLQSMVAGTCQPEPSCPGTGWESRGGLVQDNFGVFLLGWGGVETATPGAADGSVCGPEASQLKGLSLINLFVHLSNKSLKQQMIIAASPINSLPHIRCLSRCL